MQNFLAHLKQFRHFSCFLFGVFALLHFTPSSAEEKFLDVDQAFSLQSHYQPSQIEFDWVIAPKHYLYQSAFAVITHPQSTLSTFSLPKADRKYDPNFEKTVDIYYNHVQLTQPITTTSPPTFTHIGITYQGCAEAGLCYPPTTKWFKINHTSKRLENSEDPTAQAVITTTQSAPPSINSLALNYPAPSSILGQIFSGQDTSGKVALSILNQNNIWTTIGAFFLFGVLLSFTPCVLPMIPILSSIIIGNDKAPTTKSRGLFLAGSYSLGMAIIYTGLGIAAGLIGTGMAAYLQKPWVLGVFASILVVFAGSMFDWYVIQLPNFLQNKLSEKTHQIKGGSFFGAFLMGALSSLIVGPCVGPALAGALLFISQTGNAVLGGTALFFMACGMSVPLLLTGVSAGKLLPKAGNWMTTLKHGFGILLVATAVWMLAPVLSIRWQLLLWAGVASFTAFVIGYLNRNTLPIWRWLVALPFIVLSGIWLVSAATGGQSVLHPVDHLIGRAAKTTHTFIKIHSSAELETLVSTSNKPIMLDFYADWCTACKEMEHLTFSDSQVQQTLSGFTTIQIDVTANTPDQQSLMKRYNLFGAPAILFFYPASSTEIAGTRILGFVKASQFNEHIKKTLSDSKKTVSPVRNTQ